MTFTLGKFFPKKPFNEPSLDLSNPLWKEIEGGYKGSPCDASVILRRLEKTQTIQELDIVYKELWDELHHQGDVGLASYYAVPHLVRIAKQNKLIDYNVLSLVSLIEIQRHKSDNPKMPKALDTDYKRAIVELGELTQCVMHQNWDLTLSSAVLTAIAISKGQIKLANVILNLDSEDVIDEFLDMY